jgi:hypothetical protein
MIASATAYGSMRYSPVSSSCLILSTFSVFMTSRTDPLACSIIGAAPDVRQQV